MLNLYFILFTLIAVTHNVLFWSVLDFVEVFRKMSRIEGIDDDVLVLLFLIAVLIFCFVAWNSTFVPDQRNLVVVDRARLEQLFRRLRNGRNASNTAPQNSFGTSEVVAEAGSLVTPNLQTSPIEEPNSERGGPAYTVSSDQIPSDLNTETHSTQISNDNSEQVQEHGQGFDQSSRLAENAAEGSERSELQTKNIDVSVLRRRRLDFLKKDNIAVEQQSFENSSSQASNTNVEAEAPSTQPEKKTSEEPKVESPQPPKIPESTPETESHGKS